MRGFGTAVVLDHASGFFTVYAGLTNINVKEGQTVRTGNVLGQVSTPPGDKQANLYFELRQGSDAINPLPYFSKDQIRRHP
jgi:septal ring factor EnvC (AmiA/AmiB activator)